MSGAGSGLTPRESRSDRLNARAQLILATATVGALIVAIVVACQGQATVNRNSQVTLRQSEDTQLSTAITSIGAPDQAEQVAGLLLLTQNTMSRITNMNQSGEPATDVHEDYVTALEILSGYLSSHSQAYLAAVSAAGFGLGYGPPPSLFPLAITYAGDQVASLMAMQSNVQALRPGRPSIDLSSDELYQQYWYHVNFGWVTAYMPGIDLRGAELGSSQWSANSDLEHSFLQCADLTNANFRGADLKFADLNGANVQGADFRGAKLEHAKITELYGTAQWSQQPSGITFLPVSAWHQGACLNTVGRGTPPKTTTTTSSPATSSSAVPSSSPTPTPSASR